jgi:hypothetical protein
MFKFSLCLNIKYKYKFKFKFKIKLPSFLVCFIFTIWCSDAALVLVIRVL